MQNDGQHYAILDTGTSLITISKSMFDDFKVKLQNSVTGFFCSDLLPFCLSVQQSCENYYADMPVLEFELSDGNNTHKFELEPWQYTINGSDMMDSADGDPFGGSTCIVAVSYMDADVIILGDPFLRKYLSSFDYSTNKITIG